jgi:hypothetical protein
MQPQRLAASSLLCALALAPLFSSPAQADGSNTVAQCIQSWPEARYRGLGYNHIVHLKNACARPAECDVATDVNPQAQHVSVAGGTAVEVNTFMGSPARVFVPKVTCTM